MRLHKKHDGFTLIELLVVIIIIGILLTLVLLTYSGVQAKNRNNQRQTSIDTVQSQLEAYYAENSRYPTIANLNDSAWRKANLKNLNASDLQDPSWASSDTECTKDGGSLVISKPATDCYSYQVTSSDGSACNNDAVVCAQYTLTAQLEGGDKYVKSSLN